MRNLVALCLCIVLLITVVPYANADEPLETLFLNEFTLDNGITVIDKVTTYSQARSTDKIAFRERSFYDGDTLVAYIRFEATFRYDGGTVSVISKSITHTDTYDGWEYVQNSFSSSGGTVTLNAKLTKWFIFHTSFTMTLSCDKNGNISYT